MIRVPTLVKSYLENEENIPLIEVKGTKWYHITQREKDSLIRFRDRVDSIPEEEWRNWSEDKKLKYSFMGSLADRVIRNCVIKEENL